MKEELFLCSRVYTFWKGGKEGNFISTWMNCMSSNTLDVIFLNYSKAFDEVHQAILSGKLQALEVSCPLLGWLKTFLQSRLMRAIVSGSESYSYPVLSVVPSARYSVLYFF